MTAPLVTEAQVTRDLMALRRLLETRWAGHNAGSDDTYCLSTGARHVVGIMGDAWPVWNTLDALARLRGYKGCITFNDDPTTHHADILAFIDRAIAQSRAVEG